MTSTTASTNVVAKIAAVVAGLGLVAMTFAPAAKADTASDQAMIASLQAQLAALQAKMSTSTMTTGSTMMTTMFSTDLTVGSQGASVTALQNWLISKGFTISAGATGYFGAQTKAALASYQASVGISPAVGYFGPITRAKANASSSTTTTTTTTTGGTTTTTGTTTSTTLSGGEGSIDNFKTVGASNTSLNQGQNDQVLGFEFKADGSDLNVSRVDFDVVNNNNVSSTSGTIRPWGVFQTATLMRGSTVIGTIDASNQANWSQDGTANGSPFVATGNQIYRIRFDGLHDVVQNGSTADYYLNFTTQNGISDSNSGGVYAVLLPTQGLRATDAKGIDQYSTATVYTTVSVNNTTNGSVVLGTGSDNPQTTTVQGDSNVSTTGITLLTFTLQAKSTDVNLYSIPVTVVASSSASSTIVRSLKLYQGSTLLDTESIASNQTGNITFQNLNTVITKGTTDNFKVVAEINKIDNTNFKEGSSLLVSVPGTGIDVENGSNTITVTGSAAGNVISFRSLGLAADSSPSSATAVSTLNAGGGGTAQTGTFTFTFNVTAFGQDIFVGTTQSAFSATLYTTTASGTQTTAAPSTSAISSTADRDSGTNVYVIHSGQTRQITISVSENPGNGRYFYARLNSLNFGLSNTDTTSRSITLPSTYQTPQVIVQS